ncbi:MAG: DUF885 domain-containing protein, partial [Thermoanaerobaculia bacterium]|nr:DUF885 domain-containing protein [Thermoanaerobaculia bacterium]
MRSISVLLLLALAVASPLCADEAAKLHALFDREWEARLAAHPLQATSVGRHEYDALLGSSSMAAMEAEVAAARGFLAELAAIDEAKLGDEDRVSHQMFRRQLENRIHDFEVGDYVFPINADSGFHMGFARLGKEMRLASTTDYRNYIARLRAWPRVVDEQIANLTIGLEKGWTLPRVVLEGYTDTITAHIVDDPTKSELFEPFRAFPAGVPEADRAALVAAGKAAITEAIVPGYRRFLEFMEKRYIPGARTTLGASAMPGGKAFYDHLVHQYTTLPLTAEEVHQIGLAEVARIEAEMKEVIRQVGFQGTFAEFLHFLRTDPRFYPKTPEELLMRAAYIAKRMDGKLPSLFGRLPRTPYTVEPVPDSIAPKYTGGRYVEAPVGSTQPGIYWVNTYKLEVRPFYNQEALTLHEAVPGHHLQIALNQELENLPEFRRHSYLSVFGEGWGLYSEWLGLEAGFYTDPYSNFGRLTYEMWRACRLVVDTGLHAFGWTRQQVIDYMASRTALSLHEVTTETDRYISWPGQALSYKIGEIKIRELRKRAESELGTKFDVR